MPLVSSAVKTCMNTRKGISERISIGIHMWWFGGIYVVSSIEVHYYAYYNIIKPSKVIVLENLRYNMMLCFDVLRVFFFFPLKVCQGLLGMTKKENLIIVRVFVSLLFIFFIVEGG